MQDYFRTIFALFLLTLLIFSDAQADTVEQLVISLHSEDFELAETDISTLVIGEARTIESDAGKIIDILRTADGVDIYVDGNLLEMNFELDVQDEDDFMGNRIESVCDNEEVCEDSVIILKGGDSGAWEWVSANGDKVFLHREVEIRCSDDGEEISCNDRVSGVSDDEDIDFDSLHDAHGDGQEHAVIVIKKMQITED
jgi:hypothetical protein